jgi:hypothetical protein
MNIKCLPLIICITYIPIASAEIAPTEALSAAMLQSSSSDIQHCSEITKEIRDSGYPFTCFSNVNDTDNKGHSFSDRAFISCDEGQSLSPNTWPTEIELNNGGGYVSWMHLSWQEADDGRIYSRTSAHVALGYVARVELPNTARCVFVKVKINALFNPSMEIYDSILKTENIKYKYSAKNVYQIAVKTSGTIYNPTAFQSKPDRFSTPVQPQKRNSVVIYTDTNTNGLSEFITEDTPYLGTFSDQMSSFIIPNSWTVRFYEHADYQGGYYTRSGRDKHYENTDGFNDKISSVKILSKG